MTFVCHFIIIPEISVNIQLTELHILCLWDFIRMSIIFIFLISLNRVFFVLYIRNFRPFDPVIQKQITRWHQNVGISHHPFAPVSNLIRYPYVSNHVKISNINNIFFKEFKLNDFNVVVDKYILYLMPTFPERGNYINAITIPVSFTIYFNVFLFVSVFLLLLYFPL